MAALSLIGANILNQSTAQRSSTTGREQRRNTAAVLRAAAPGANAVNAVARRQQAALAFARKRQKEAQQAQGIATTVEAGGQVLQLAASNFGQEALSGIIGGTETAAATSASVTPAVTSTVTSATPALAAAAVDTGEAALALGGSGEFLAGTTTVGAETTVTGTGTGATAGAAPAGTAAGIAGGASGAAVGGAVGSHIGQAVGGGVEGGVSGAAAGAITGAIVGTVLAPGLGTVIGAIGGALIGGLGGSGVCIIVTACHGKDSAEVQIAREFRDKKMSSEQIRGYYMLAEGLVPKMESDAAYCEIIRKSLVAPLIRYGAYVLLKTPVIPSPEDRLTAHRFLDLCSEMGKKVPSFVRQNGDQV